MAMTSSSRISSRMLVLNEHAVAVTSLAFRQLEYQDVSHAVGVAVLDEAHHFSELGAAGGILSGESRVGKFADYG